MVDVMPEAQPPARQPCSAKIVGQWLHVLDGEAALRVFDLGAFGKGLLSRSRPEGFVTALSCVRFWLRLLGAFFIFFGGALCVVSVPVMAMCCP